MPRIACLLVPDLPVAAACRADPDLAGPPLVLAEGERRRTRASSPPRARGARARRARRSTHRGQARAVAADLVVRRRDPAAERSAAHALADVAASLAIRVEVAADGAVFLDAEGAAHLVGERGAASRRRSSRARRASGSRRAPASAPA